MTRQDIQFIAIMTHILIIIIAVLIAPKPIPLPIIGFIISIVWMCSLMSEFTFETYTVLFITWIYNYRYDNAVKKGLVLHIDSTKYNLTLYTEIIKNMNSKYDVFMNLGEPYDFLYNDFANNSPLYNAAIIFKNKEQKAEYILRAI